MSRTKMSCEEFRALATQVLWSVGLPFEGTFSSAVAWHASQIVNTRENTAILGKLYDLQDQHGHGSPHDAVVDVLINGGVVPTEDYFIEPSAWLEMGFEIYENGNGSHGVCIPRNMRQPAGLDGASNSDRQAK